jgi:hypothetical protein
MRSQFAKINRPSHELNVNLQVPFASRFVLSANEHFSVSTLDAIEVDPGREYFFDLGRFTRNEVNGSLRMEVGPRLNLFVGGAANRVRFQEESSFFDYDQDRASAGLEFLVNEGVQARLGYGFERTPASPDRAVIESEAHGVQLSLTGEPMPLLTASISGGYRRQDSPRAAPGGQTFEGFTLSASLSKEVTRRTRLTLTGGRQVYPSSFESNAFYVGNSDDATLSLGLMLGLSGRVGGGYHWNGYRTTSSALGEPREDRLYGWTAGLSRTLNRWSYLRFDYAWSRRKSNIRALENESSMLLIQLAITPFDASTSSTPSQ